MKVRIVLLILSVSILLFSCEKDMPFPPELSNDEITLAENTYILNAADHLALEAVTSDELTFSTDSDAHITQVEVGHIIVSDVVVDKAPNGFLRRITGIAQSGNVLILSTVNAKLTEAIQSCQVRHVELFDANDFSGKTNLDLSLNLGDDSPIEGEVEINPGLIFDLDIGFFEVTYAKMGIQLDYNAMATIQTASDIQYMLKEDLIDKSLSNFTIWIGGIFPLVITPDFELEAGFEYNAGVAFATTLTLSGETTYYVEKDANGWDTGKETDENAAVLAIAGNIGAAFELYLQPELEFEFYDIDAVETTLYAKKSVHGQVSFSTDEGFSCKFHCALSLGGALEVEILGFEINPSIEVTVVEFPAFYECPENGLTDDINDFLPPDVLEEIIDIGMPIYEGYDPPNLEGTYFVSPFILKNTTVPGESLNQAFADVTLLFSDQNNETLSIMMDYTQVSSEGGGIGSYIVGSGNAFSVFAEVDIVASGSPAKMAFVISGEVVSNDIVDLHWATFMLEDFGDPSNVLIDIGQGRLLYDSDGLSPKL